MTDPIPAPVRVCSLRAPDAAERAGRWRALLRDSLRRRDATAAGLRLELRPRDGVAAELDELVAAERECCPLLALTVEHGKERLVLHVDAPTGAREIVAAMFGGPRP